MKTLILAIAVIGCGGPARQDPNAPGGEPGRMGSMSQKHDMHTRAVDPGKKGEEMGHEIPPQIAAFHEVLAPHWHADRGPQRMTDTCAAIPQFRSDADAIATAQPPADGDAAAWSAGGKQLADAVAALEATCNASDATAFEPAFERVHAAFHHVMEDAGGHDQHSEHDEHADHEH
jgi:hypothetical protein